MQPPKRTFATVGRDGAPARARTAVLAAFMACLCACTRMLGQVAAPAPTHGGDEAFRVVPTPSADDSILGRVVQYEPAPATSFEAEARPNPCEQFLTPVSEHELVQEVHRAHRLGGKVEARATLHGFGFSGGTESDTHLVFDLSTTRKIVRRDTHEYIACCREHDCGFGYISTLVFGHGEYASGRETRVKGEADYLGVAGAGGSVNVAASERKRVEGWVLAVVTPHEVLRNMNDTRSRGFIAGGAAGFALGVSGLGLMAFGLVRGPQLEEEHERRPEERDQISQQIKRANALAIAGGVTGGALTAAGVALLVIGVHGRQRRTFAVVPTSNGTGGGAALAGRF